MAESLRDQQVRLANRSLDIAYRGARDIGHVIGPALVHKGRARCDGRIDRRGGGLRLVVDSDSFERFGEPHGIDCDDDGDGLADIADNRLRKHVLVERAESSL